jgi:hypothetical protein
MNLYTRSALKILQHLHAHIDQLNRSLPTILQAEALAEALTAAGIKTEACYGMHNGTHLRASLSKGQLPQAINTLHDQAEKFHRIVIIERNERFVLAPSNLDDTETRIIELTFEEI